MVATVARIDVNDMQGTTAAESVGSTVDVIVGAIDGEGRCAHWHSAVDVVANRCATCNKWFACSLCHAEIADHPFGPMPLDVPAAMCGACGYTMNYHEYSAATSRLARPACPACGHGFNPGCGLHAGIYFEL